MEFIIHRKTKLYLNLLTLTLFGILTVSANASFSDVNIQSEITGTVVDENGDLLPGVSIMIVGTTQGTQTDFDGKYSILASQGDTLVFSFVGMISQEQIIGEETTIDVVLITDTNVLDEVIVTGYTEVKKANLTGAVSTLDGEEMMERPVANTTSLLQGKMAGVRINQGSGQPGKENSFIRIRGTGTFSGAGSDPLVIVDGISGSLNDVNPESIESISVLKDAASAAIYGARAANGVIVVTTKNGKKGDLELSYHGNFGFQSAAIVPDFVTSSVEYMEMWNQAHLRQGIDNLFPQSDIDAYRNADPGDPKYPNFDWMDHSMNTAFVQRHTLNASGGSEKTNFFVNGTILDQPGVVIGHDYRSYSGQLKIETKVTDFITFGANVAYKSGKRKEPTFTDSDFILMIYGAQPMYSPYLADGSGRYTHNAWPEKWVNRNPEMIANEGGNYSSSEVLRINSFIKVDILPELTWLVKGAVEISNNFNKLHGYGVDSYSFSNNEYYSNGWPAFDGVRDSYSHTVLPTFFSTLAYNKTFSEAHNFSALVGYNQENYENRWAQASRKDFNFSYIDQINGGGTERQTTGGSASEWAIQSFFGRIAYDYKGKYLFEANARYDGTSRITEDNRWGFFPSFSVGWRLSDEDFMGDVDWVDDLKLRASWGQLGNQNIGNYPYQDVLTIVNYPRGSSLDQGVIETKLTDKNLEWETTTSTDIGLDMNLWNSLIYLTFDWYKKDTEGILASQQIQSSVGLNPPIVNYSSMENKGIEIQAGHRNTIGDFTYSVDLNFAKNKNKVTKVLSDPFDRIVGRPVGEYFIVEWDGIFNSQAEIDAAPTHPYTPKPGDIRLKDANGDGEIDSDDRVFVSGAHPDFTYGATFNLRWKNFDMSLFFQGVEGQKRYVDWWGFYPFTQGTAPTTNWRNAWTPENQSQTTPALWTFSTYNYAPNTYRSTHYLHDASYLRLKNLQIGYNFPKEVIQKVKLDDLRVYFSGDNLITWTQMPNVDPERLGTQWWSNRGSVYPQTKIVSFGVKFKF